jgi:hypothetical protein
VPKIAVFLKSNLGSCDIAVPLMLGVREHVQNLDVEFYSFDKSTHSIIRKNRVLWDAINEIGVFPDIPKLTSRGGMIGRAVRWSLLGRLILLGLLGQLTIIHFGTLSHGLMRLLYLSNRRRCYDLHQHAYGLPQSIWDAIALRLSLEGKAVTAELETPVQSGTRVFFDDFSPKRLGLSGNEYLVASPLRRQRIWVEYLKSVSEKYFRESHPSVKDQQVITFVTAISSNILLDDSGALRQKFSETLDVLSDVVPGVPILVKPHYEQEIPIIEEEIAARPGTHIEITHLHTGVLATRSKFFIANWVSTALADASTQSVPTIEYSDYSAALIDVAKGKSVWPGLVSHFVNDDAGELRNNLREVMGTERSRSEQDGGGNTGVDLALLLANQLNGRKSDITTGAAE